MQKKTNIGLWVSHEILSSYVKKLTNFKTIWQMLDHTKHDIFPTFMTLRCLEYLGALGWNDEIKKENGLVDFSTGLVNHDYRCKIYYLLSSESFVLISFNMNIENGDQKYTIINSKILQTYDIIH